MPVTVFTQPVCLETREQEHVKMYVQLDGNAKPISFTMFTLTDRQYLGTGMRADLYYLDVQPQDCPAEDHKWIAETCGDGLKQVVYADALDELLEWFNQHHKTILGR